MTLQVGDEIPPLDKVVYQRALDEREFSEDSIHNDDHTRQHGYPGALVSSYVLCGYMSEPMVELFGASWFTTGKIRLTFIGTGVQQGDPVRIGGRVKEIDGGRATVELWMEKEDGGTAAVGEASGFL